MKDFEMVFEYINLERNNPIGCGRLAPLIKMVNDREEIVKELLDRPENEHHNNLLCFLDYGLNNYLDINYWREPDDMETTINAIFYVLETFRDLDEETKWRIDGEEFVNLLKNKK